jgi:uncharacterized protein
MIAPELLEILCCPETRQPLQPADASLVALLNQKIAEKKLKNKRGDVVAETIDGALLRADGKRAFLVRQSIPVMISDEAVPASEWLQSA